MQLSTLVLPAPFGPISANSSPGSTAKDTSSSTVKPPKRRLRCVDGKLSHTTSATGDIA